MSRYLLLAIFLLAIGSSQLVAQTRVAAIGDSITFGVGIADPDGRYPSQLQSLLGSGYVVQNFGKSGADVLQINNGPYINTTEHQDALAFAPEIVISNLGINDFSLFLDNQQAFVDDYVELLSECAALPTTPDIYLWTQLAPVFSPNSNAGLIAAQRAQVNLRLSEFASAVGATGINMYAPLAKHPELFSVGLHPDAAGAGMIAKFTAVSVFGPMSNGVDGDVNQDGVVSTGSGNPADDDLAKFRLGWRSDTSGFSQLDQTLLGDLNLDGITDLADASILHELIATQTSASDVLALSQSRVSLPEPKSSGLVLLGGLLVLAAGWIRRKGCSLELLQFS